MEVKKIGNTQRLTPKARKIIQDVLIVTGKKSGANLIIEDALCEKYPLFSVMYDKDNKKGNKKK